MALSENKANLARFLSEQLITRAPESKEIVTAGGFRDELEVRSSTPTTPLSCLIANHEEADTRLALHAMNVTNDAVVVSARDTDVLVILVSHFHRMHCKELWMKAGTSKKEKYIPIHNVACNLPTSCFQALIPFHALTGCDTYQVIQRHPRGKYSKNITLFCKIWVKIIAMKKVSRMQRNSSVICTTQATQVPLMKHDIFSSSKKENRRHCHQLAMLCTITSSERITNPLYGRKHTILYKSYLHHLIGDGKRPTQD